MVHGILQFTPNDDATRAHRFRGDEDALSRSSSLAQFAPVFVCTPEGSAARAQRNPPEIKGQGAARPLAPRFETSSRVVTLGEVSTMILPRVHLRKPCYDFSFL
ncbi:unnamed protein product [Prunus brigantina]